MIKISGLRDLERFGIAPLTGEADKLNLRILCDLTGAGAEVVREAFGLKHDTDFQDNWNHGDGHNPHVGSILLDGYDNNLICLLGLMGFIHQAKKTCPINRQGVHQAVFVHNKRHSVSEEGIEIRTATECIGFESDERIFRALKNHNDQSVGRMFRYTGGDWLYQRGEEPKEVFNLKVLLGGDIQRMWDLAELGGQTRNRHQMSGRTV